MTHNQISAAVIDTCVDIQRRFGPGLLESDYQAVLEHELTKRGSRVRCEVPVSDQQINFDLFLWWQSL